MKKIVPFLLALLYLLSCDKEDTAESTPDCIENRIKEIAGAEVWNESSS